MLMDKIIIAVLIGVLLSLVTVLGDVFVKHALLQFQFSGWKWLLLGAIIYGLTAVGWFFVMRKAKLSTLGVVYSASIIIFLTLFSVLYFKEKISAIELVGILMAIGSLMILSRFG